MDLVKKWWRFILVGVALGLGIIYFKDLGLVKTDFKANKTIVSDGKTQVVVDKKMVSLEKQITGVVIAWDGDKSELLFKLDGKNNVEKIKVDSSKMSLFIPEAQHKTDAVLPLNNGDSRWLTAFCEKDTLIIGYESELFPTVEALSSA